MMPRSRLQATHTDPSNGRRRRPGVPFMIIAALALAPAAVLAQNETGWDEYEWEPGEGLHKEEWYDPSDWVTDVGEEGIDYEYDDWYEYDGTYDTYGYDYDYNYNDNWEYGYHYDEASGEWVYGYHYEDDDLYDYGENDLEYGYHYDDVTNEWEYGYHYDDVDAYDYGYDTFNNPDYSYNQTLRGEVVGFQRMRASNGRPESIRLKVRSQDGDTRIVQLGDVTYVDRNLPKLRKGDRIAIRGHRIRSGDRSLFKVSEIRGPNGSFSIPEYRYSQTIEGKLAGIDRAVVRNGQLKALIAKVKTGDGRKMKVLLGSPDQLRRKGVEIRPDERVELTGWSRSDDQGRTFFIQDVSIHGESAAPQNADQSSDRRERDQSRQNGQMQSRQQQNQRQQASASGTVEAFKRISLQGQRDEHTLVRLRMQDGRKVVVNIGPNRSVGSLNLSSGDRVSVKGFRARIDGKPVLFARQMKVQGEAVNLRWEPSRNRGQS